MSYQVLARKWRPQNFAQVVGQNHVQTALSNALDQQRLHHAYLFTGTRGVGKTTIARILAKCLNCEQGISSEPCGTCHSCCEVTEGRFIDLIEVDAASRTKVEDTRDLLDKIQYAPTQGRFKVYLIDEVHMLSKHSFNALLKTLEEPPPHVKFLLATTDPQNLPATVLSRCLQFNLKRMSIDTIQQHLDFLLQQESITSTPKALRQIAHAADGSMRDALSLLDQAIVFGAGSVQENSVREMLGGVAHEPLIALLEAVIEGSGQQVLTAMESLSHSTPDYEIAADTLIHLLHQLSLIQLVDPIDQENAELKLLAQRLSPEDVQLYYQIALYGRRDLPLSPDLRMGFEMIVLRMLAFRPVDMHAVDNLNSKKKPRIAPQIVHPKQIAIDSPEKHVAKASVSNVTLKTNHTATTVIPSKPPQNQLKINSEPNHIPSSKTEVDSKNTQQALVADNVPIRKPEISNRNTQQDLTSENVQSKPISVEQKNANLVKIHNQWHDWLPKLNLKGMSAEFARNCYLVTHTDEMVQVCVSAVGENLHNKATEQELQQALSLYFATPIKLKIVLNSDDEQAQYNIENLETPAQKKQRARQEKQAEAEQAIYNDSFIKKLQQHFDATIMVNSIKPRMAS